MRRLKGGRGHGGKGEVDYRSGNVAEVVEGLPGRLEHKVATKYMWPFNLIKIKSD